MSSQTFQILASPKDRWRVANFLSRPELKFKGRQRRLELEGFKRALALDAPMAAITGGRAGYVTRATDESLHSFTVTEEKAAFFSECVDQVELTAGELSLIQPILSQLDNKAPAGDTSGAPTLDPKSEDWTPSSSPIVDNPERLVEVLAEIFRLSNGDFKKASDLFLKEIEATNPRTQKSGRLVAV